MERTDWQELAARFPRETLVRDVSAYADVFAAIDEALRRAATVEPSPDECDVQLARDIESGDEVPFVIWRVPVVPVRVPSTVRLCVGLLQFGRWPVHREMPGACLPHVDTLLKRKLRPTLDEAIDLAAFLVTRAPRDDREDYNEPSAPILKLIENNFRPPVPPPLAEGLREARRRVAVTRENYLAALKLWRGKPQTKRFDKWTQRLNQLLGE